MNSSRFDRISKHFAERRAQRAVAREATPAPGNTSGHKPAMLFVQSFRAGAITPKEGAEGRYTLSLEGGHSQTIHFTNRPDRIVGADPTPAFLDGLGFLPDNPPNAALVVETAPGETDVAVVELFSPVYDDLTGGVTYEIEVLGNWRAELGVELQEAPTDLAALAPSFGAAHLFIDDCPDIWVSCHTSSGVVGQFGPMGACWNYALCIPCEPYGHVQPDRCATVNYWTDRCEAAFRQECDEGYWDEGCSARFSYPASNFVCLEP